MSDGRQGHLPSACGDGSHRGLRGGRRARSWRHGRRVPRSPARSRPTGGDQAPRHRRRANGRTTRPRGATTRRSQQPNIVTVIDVGRHEGQPFYVMTYCAGGTRDVEITTPVRQRTRAGRGGDAEQVFDRRHYVLVTTSFARFAVAHAEERVGTCGEGLENLQRAMNRIETPPSRCALVCYPLIGATSSDGEIGIRVLGISWSRESR